MTGGPGGKAFREALAALGAAEHLLSCEQLRRLDDEGYLFIERLLGTEEVAIMRERFDELVALEGSLAGHEVHQEEGTERLADLVNKGREWEVCYSHPQLLAAVDHIFGGHPFKLSSLNARSALPGHGHQGLHADWHTPVTDEDYQVANSFWMLDDFTTQNGASRVVPGSHRLGHWASEEIGDPASRHPREVVLTGPAGSVVVINAHLWHGGTRNTSRGVRRVAHGYWVRREHPQQTNQQDYIRPETYARLSDAQRLLLDVRQP